MDSGNSNSSETPAHPLVESTPPTQRRTRGSRQKAVDSVTKKFLRNFDPEHSEREKRCHLPCVKCSSPKCSHECRNNRKWTYESIENEGSDIIIKNPLLKES
ncbi:uncharacterized protein LOC117161132 isoform X2 [Bombus vancouverensis nearcticus]|uniref:uncharacterized protein LOC117161132 isoform X2 n=1 Tax=Bombus vancouverensis nearcticus TaxID=2705178 RepID=UPI00212EFB16